MKISVVTTIKNGAQFLRECFLSVLTQEARVDLEYIVVDGGSTDDTPAIIRETQEMVAEGWLGSGLDHVEFRTFDRPDQSMYAGLAYGFAKVTGDAVLYINADDVLHPLAFYHIDSTLRKYPDVQWVSGYPNQINENGSVFYRSLPWKYRRSFIQKGLYGRSLPFIQQESCFWRSSLLGEIDPDELAAFRLAGDQYIWNRFSQKAGLDVLPHYIGGHRTHGDQLSHRHREAYYQEFGDIYQGRSSLSGREKWLILIDKLRWQLPGPIKKKLGRHYLQTV